jgi:hypothetical protein
MTSEANGFGVSWNSGDMGPADYHAVFATIAERNAFSERVAEAGCLDIRHFPAVDAVTGEGVDGGVMVGPYKRKVRR